MQIFRLVSRRGNNKIRLNFPLRYLILTYECAAYANQVTRRLIIYHSWSAIPATDYYSGMSMEDGHTILKDLAANSADHVWCHHHHHVCYHAIKWYPADSRLEIGTTIETLHDIHPFPARQDAKYELGNSRKGGQISRKCVLGSRNRSEAAKVEKWKVTVSRCMPRLNKLKTVIGTSS